MGDQKAKKIREILQETIRKAGDVFDHRQTRIIATCNQEIYQKIVKRIFF